MKIIQHTDDILIIEEKGWISALILGGFSLLFGALGIWALVELEISGLVFLALSAAIGFAFYRLVENFQAVFSRVDNTVEFRNKSLYQDKRKKYQLSEFSGSYVQEKHSTSSSGNSRKMSRINLTRVGDGEQLPMTNAFTSGEEYEGISDAINTWIKN